MTRYFLAMISSMIDLHEKNHNRLPLSCKGCFWTATKGNSATALKVIIISNVMQTFDEKNFLRTYILAKTSDRNYKICRLAMDTSYSGEKLKPLLLLGLFYRLNCDDTLYVSAHS